MEDFGMEKKEEVTASLSVAPVVGVQAAGQAGSRALVAGTWLKTHLTQPEKSVLQEEILTLGDLGQVGASPQRRSTPKEAEIEFPLISSHSPLLLAPKWKVKRPARWDESGEWRYLTACHGHLVERLMEKFNWLDDKEMILVAWYVISARGNARESLPPSC